MPERYDAIVLGAQPAGLIASIILGRAGRRVALLDTPRSTPGVRLVSLPALKDAIGLEQHPSLMRRVSRLRRVSTHGRDWAITEACTADLAKADLVSAEMDDFLAGLGKLAVEAGVNRRSGFKGLIREASGRVLGANTQDAAELYASVVLVADGADSETAQALSPHAEFPQDEYTQLVEETWRLPEGEISRRLGQPEAEGTLILPAGDCTGGVAGIKAWILPGTQTLTLGAMAPVESLEEAHFALPKALDRVALHPAFENLLRGAERGERAGSTRLAGGRRHFRSFFGDGWMILGSAAGLYDPRHPYEIRVELTSGKCAAEAVLHALAVRDYSRTTLGLYKRMLLDSYVMADIEGAASENERRRRQPDLDGYYPGLMVRRLTLELGAGITPRGEARDALEAEAARERPMWEQIKAGLGGVRLV